MVLLSMWLFITLIVSLPSLISHPKGVMQAREAFQARYITFEHFFGFDGCSGFHQFIWRNYLSVWKKLKSKTIPESKNTAVIAGLLICYWLFSQSDQGYTNMWELYSHWHSSPKECWWVFANTLSEKLPWWGTKKMGKNN